MARPSIRGGFGIFFQDRLPGFLNLTQGSFVPNTISLALTNPGMYGATAGANPGGPFSNPYCTGCSASSVPNPFPFTLPFPKNQVFPNAFQVAEYDPSGNFQVPVTDDFNLIVEQQFAPNWTMRLAYVGSVSRHQLVNLELNPEVNNGNGQHQSAPRLQHARLSSARAATSQPAQTAYSQIVETAMIGNAHYNSLQATLEKTMSHGLSILFNYTFSKSYDDMPQATRVSNTEDVNPGESYVYPLYPSNATNIPAAAYVSDIKALDRGLSDIDHTHVLSASYVYDLPKLHSGFAAVRAIVNGWRTTGLIRFRSGDVLTAYMGSDVSLTDLGQDRAQRDFTQSAYLKVPGGGHCGAGKSCVNWLNASRLLRSRQHRPRHWLRQRHERQPARPVASPTGTPPSSAPSPSGAKPTSTSASNTSTSSTTPELGNPKHRVSNPAFGTITSTQGDPRIAQFSLKYVF